MLNRYLSRPLDRFLAGHGVTITEFQVLVVLQEGPARSLALVRRLRLDPAPTGRALARLEQRGLVRREFPTWRFSEWILEPSGGIHLEMLEPGWVAVNHDTHWLLGRSSRSRWCVSSISSAPQSRRSTRGGSRIEGVNPEAWNQAGDRGDRRNHTTDRAGRRR
jgi:hypothetical protein